MEPRNGENLSPENRGGKLDGAGTIFEPRKGIAEGRDF